MIDVFRPMTTDAQRKQRAAYRQYPIERDGTPDYARRTLTLREASMARYSHRPTRVRELDRSLFDAQYKSFDRSRTTSAEMLLLLAMLKVNAAEAYGVNTTFESVKRRAEAQNDDIELRLLIEETYHTRILLSAASLYGLTIDAPYNPPLGLRGLILLLPITARIWLQDRTVI